MHSNTTRSYENRFDVTLTLIFQDWEFGIEFQTEKQVTLRCQTLMLTQ